MIDAQKYLEELKISQDQQPDKNIPIWIRRVAEAINPDIKLSEGQRKFTLGLIQDFLDGVRSYSNLAVIVNYINNCKS